MQLIIYGIDDRDPLVDFLVRGTEGVVRDLGVCDPSDGVMLQQLNGTAFNLGVKQREMNRDIGVLVYHIHKDISYGDSHSQLFPALPNESFFLCFTRLNFTADILPQQPSCFIIRPLTDQEFFSIPYQRCYYFGYVGSFLRLVS